MQKLNHHPDRGGDVAFAQLLNKAAQTLCDPQTRSHYDLLRQQVASTRQGKTASSQDDTTGFCWGEPGGSPNGTSRQRPNGQQQTDSDTTSGNRGHQSTAQMNPDSPDTATTNSVALPTKPHCLFCLTPYPATTVAPLTNSDAYENTRRCRVCNGAKDPIDQMPQSSNEELRRMHRQHHDSKASLWLRWPATMHASSTLEDFSPSGCALLFADAIDTGQIVMIETGLFNAICCVRHCKPATNGSFRIGLEFVTLDMQALSGAFLNASA